MLQKTEMKAKSLEITVEQKNKENEVKFKFVSYISNNLCLIFAGVDRHL